MNQMKRTGYQLFVKQKQNQDHLIYLYNICSYEDDQIIIVIDQYGKLIKSIELQQKILDIYCCIDPRFIILEYEYKEFAIKDLLEHQEQRYKGEIIGQNENNILFKEDEKYYILRIKEKLLSQFSQDMNYIAWIGKLIIAEEKEFLVFNTLNRQLFKVSLKTYISQKKDIFSLSQNYLILKTISLASLLNYYEENFFILHISKLNNKIKIVRQIKTKLGWSQKNYCQVNRQFVIFRVVNHLKIINIIKATSQIIPINNDQIFFIKNGQLNILKPFQEEFVINSLYKL